MPFVLLACKAVKENNNGNSDKLINSSNPEEIKRRLNEIELNVVQLDEYKSNKSQIKASSISSIKNVILEAEDPSLKDKVKVEVENIKNADDSSGELTLALKISYENTSINKNLTISGFRKSNDGFIDLRFEQRFAPNSNKLQEYIDQDLFEQFKLDNKKYIDNFLSGYIDYVTNKNPQE
nr:lipoprotein 17-related variable surface protein [Mycoplasma phocoeninasale]